MIRTRGRPRLNVLDHQRRKPYLPGMRTCGTSLLLGLLLLSGCATTGPGGKRSLILIGSDSEVSFGKQMAEQVRSESKTFPDTAWARYVNAVGQRLVAVSDRRNIAYSFTVLEKNEINAFALPGGYLYIYTGLLKLMDNEAELAAVLGHELSHVVARHGIKRMQQVLGISLIEQIALGNRGSEAAKSAINLGIGIALQGYSRENELEADRDGVYYLYRAGYDPKAAVTMFQKLAGQEKGGRSVFERLAASHPETKERIARVEKEIEGFPPRSNLNLGKEPYQELKRRLP